MIRWSEMRLVAVLALAVAPQAATAQSCPPIDQALAEIMARERAQRADVTERLACHFPPGMSFNEAAMLLDGNGFDLLNRTERMFHRWPIGGQEFTSERIVGGGSSRALFRVTIHTLDKKIARFSAQYYAER
ncbi:hypothetical protein [Hansschlegelia zhihuaiae]|uniref:DUF930 domain-containing protein n=1 Tax=Hansschlegelia zhihuaiae TaxID=405005 RepID=A0A4Q0M5L1_9HYPH|nr:hypothetical protein [Hansschlegelia zhihuaiae]RXF68245.1 hypothetical protein EK403_20320 [Hansschlegelia zhihuaiae]